MIEIDPNMKILIVSGDPELALSCKLLLKKVGLNQVETIESGIDALRLCQTKKFSIIICNQNSKHLTGWLFVQELKNSPKIANTGVLLMGVAASPAKPEQLARYGVPPYIEAPLSSKTLMSSISSVLGDLISPNSIENRYTVAKDALIAQNSDLAIDKYKELHQLTNKSMRSTVGLIQAHEIAENESEAAGYATDLASHEDATPVGIMISLRYVYKNKDFERAAKLSETLINQTKETPLYFLATLELAEKNEQFELGEKIARLGMAQEYRLNEFSLAIAKHQLAKSQIDDALKTVVKAEKEFGKSLVGLNLQGVCLRRLEKFEASRTAYEAALKLSPMDVKIFFNLALIEKQLCHYDAALRHLNMCLKIAPSFEKAKSKILEINALQAKT